MSTKRKIDSCMGKRHAKRNKSLDTDFLNKFDTFFHPYLKTWYIRYIILNRLNTKEDLYKLNLSELLNKSLDSGDSGIKQFIRFIKEIKSLKNLVLESKNMSLLPESVWSKKEIINIFNKMPNSFIGKELADYVCCDCLNNCKRLIRAIFILTGYKCKFMRIIFGDDCCKFKRSKDYSYESWFTSHLNFCEWKIEKVG